MGRLRQAIKPTARFMAVLVAATLLAAYLVVIGVGRTALAAAIVNAPRCTYVHGTPVDGQPTANSATISNPSTSRSIRVQIQHRLPAGSWSSAGGRSGLKVSPGKAVGSGSKRVVYPGTHGYLWGYPDKDGNYPAAEEVQFRVKGADGWGGWRACD